MKSTGKLSSNNTVKKLLMEEWMSVVDWLDFMRKRFAELRESFR